MTIRVSSRVVEEVLKYRKLAPLFDTDIRVENGVEVNVLVTIMCTDKNAELKGLKLGDSYLYNESDRVYVDSIHVPMEDNFLTIYSLMDFVKQKLLAYFSNATDLFGYSTFQVATPYTFGDKLILPIIILFDDLGTALELKPRENVSLGMKKISILHETLNLDTQSKVFLTNLYHGGNKNEQSKK